MSVPGGGGPSGMAIDLIPTFKPGGALASFFRLQLAFMGQDEVHGLLFSGTHLIGVPAAVAKSLRISGNSHLRMASWSALYWMPSFVGYRSPCGCSKLCKTRHPQSIQPAAWACPDERGSSGQKLWQVEMRTVGKVSRNCTGIVQVLPGGLTYMGLLASVMFPTVSGTACFQACDWPSIAANRSTGVSRRRVARAVASLWQGVTPRAHSCRASRRLDPKAEDGGERDDGGVSMAMKTNKSPGGVAVSPGVDRRSTENPWSLSLYIYVDVCGCILSQEASDHSLIVREVLFPECGSDGLQGHTAALQGQEI